MKNPRAWIGTSGWNYGHWRKIVYPAGTASRDWLRFYAGWFDTVELNNSFYRIPQPESMREWQESTPSRFRFAVKLWRGITHFKKLKGCEQHLARFFGAADQLKAPSRAPLLVQLPPNQGKDLDRLKRFLDDLKRATPERWKVAIEFRNREWLCRELYDLLERRRVAICLHDMPGSETSEPTDARFIYVRRHGSHRRRYGGSYTSSQVASDAEKIRRWLREGKTVYVYFNNDAEGHAVKNARALKVAVEKSSGS